MSSSTRRLSLLASLEASRATRVTANLELARLAAAEAEIDQLLGTAAAQTYELDHQIDALLSTHSHLADPTTRSTG